MIVHLLKIIIFIHRRIFRHRGPERDGGKEREGCHIDGMCTVSCIRGP